MPANASPHKKKKKKKLGTSALGGYKWSCMPRKFRDKYLVISIQCL